MLRAQGKSGELAQQKFDARIKPTTKTEGGLELGGGVGWGWAWGRGGDCGGLGDWGIGVGVWVGGLGIINPTHRDKKKS